MAVQDADRRDEQCEPGRLGDLVFSRRCRHLAIAWVAVTVPLVAVAGSFVRGERAYLVAWSLASGLYTTPALFVTWRVGDRAPTADRRFWRLVFGVLVLLYGFGAALIALELTGWSALRFVSAGAISAAVVVYGIGLGWLVRDRSGRRTFRLDAVEAAIGALALASMVPLLVGDRVLSAPAAWFALPASFVTLALVVFSIWSTVLLVRLGHERTVMELLGTALVYVGAVQGALQIVEGVTDFALPAGPIIGLQCVFMGLILLAPLYVSRTEPLGLDRLPPHAQLRSGVAVAAITIAAVPILVVETVVLAPTHPWALGYTAVVIALLLVLSTIRHLLTISETRQLYADLKHAAEHRRVLLGQMMDNAGHDRHRVAAQLHEQAASSYAAFVSFLTASRGSHDEGTPIDGASAQVRHELAHQTESLRRLMLATQPLDLVPSASSERLAAPITAYVASLYGDAAPPALLLDLDPDLALDWGTETIALRIVQEAVANVARHAQATHLRVAVCLVDDQLELRVEDDGIGFDPRVVRDGAGLRTIRTFAEFARGEVRIETSPGEGTSVVAGLGSWLSAPARAATADTPVRYGPLDPPRLHLVSDPPPHHHRVPLGLP